MFCITQRKYLINKNKGKWEGYQNMSPQKNKWKNALKGKKGQKTVRHTKDTKMAILSPSISIIILKVNGLWHLGGSVG